MQQQQTNVALENANRALSSKKDPLVSALSPLQFGVKDHEDALLELASIVAVAVVTSLFVLAIWLI